MDDRLLLKKRAAEEAVGYIESGMVVGLGTGSTAELALEILAKRLSGGELKGIVGIPSSIATERLSRALGIPLATFNEHLEIDITIDGADEVDPELNMIKGGGGALLREKVLQQQSRLTVIIVDESKLSERLGSLFALPVEVIPFARKPVENYIQSLGARVTVRREAEGRLYRTDQRNVMLDCEFGPIEDPGVLASRLKERAGVAEHGLFLGLADEVIVAGEGGVRRMRRR